MKSLYIHIPFCNKICSYCDFAKFNKNNKWVDRYLISLKEEINKNYQGELLKTIYIGGGTPSSLNMNQLKELFNILKVLNIGPDYEFTFECNIEDINEDLLVLLKDNKVNRLSIGIQSFNKKILKVLGRETNVNINEKILIAKKHFKNINVDFIYGVFDTDINDLKEDLDKFYNLDINHISIYALILEDNTLLKVNNYKELDEDVQRDMYDFIRNYLKEKGYTHYEISNFAKEGYESIHNLTYWNNEEYYGFGLGASGFISKIRYENTRNLNKYLDGNHILESHVLNENENMENEMILGLRKINGVNKEKFHLKYNKKIEEVFDVKKLKENKDYYYIDSNELFISNSILIDFIS